MRAVATILAFTAALLAVLSHAAPTHTMEEFVVTSVDSGISLCVRNKHPAGMFSFAPTGVVQDGREFWAAGKALYDPAEIRVPTFLAHAEWDQDLPSYMLHAYFAKLTNASYKRHVEIGEDTHTIIMEKNRMKLRP